MSRLLRQVSPFYRIGGTSPSFLTYGPTTLHRVQTDGSYGGRKGDRIAAILYTADHHAGPKTLIQINAKSSTETEWASVALGLALAIQHKRPHVAIENDNLGVMRSLIFYRNFRSRHEYAHHYFHEIMRLTAETEWTGVRWIPRALNRADDLFHER